MLATASEQFLANLQRVQKLLAIGSHIESAKNNVLDGSDIYRAALVLSVSAFDHFVHEIVRLIMLKQFCNKAPKSSTLLANKEWKKTFSMPKKIEFDAFLRAENNRKTFQRAKQVKLAMKLITDTDIWSDISAEVDLTPNAAENRLDAIIDRRNMIAHEADIDPVWGTLRELPKEDVEQAIKFLENLASALIKTLEK